MNSKWDLNNSNDHLGQDVGFAAPSDLRAEGLQIDSSRIKIILSLLIVGLIVLGVQLLRKQILEYSIYQAQAKDQQVAKVTSEPDRGRVFAHDKTAGDFGVMESSTYKDLHPLAINLTKFNILIVPKNITEPEKVAQELSIRLDLKYDDLMQKIKTGKIYLPPIAKKVEKAKAEEIAKLNLKGVLTVPTSIRQYPEDDIASHIMGFVNFDGEGAYGIERYYNGELKGVPGVLYGIKDTRGRLIGVDDSSQAQNGLDIVLTLDSTVQFIVEEKLKEAVEKYGAQSGSIIVADPKTGRIIAMASQPNYDPNKFNEVPEDEQWKFVNAAVTNTWEPGSIMKAVTMAAAINEGKVEPDTKPDDLPGGFKNMLTIDGYEIHNSTDTSYGYETMTQVLENSDNIGMVWVANKMGDETMGKYLSDFGFGQKTGIDVEAESAGKYVNPKQWRNVHRATIAFGQGISVTPIQMVQAYSALANKGKLVKPHLLDEVISPSGEAKQIQTTEVRQVVSEETAKKVTDMLVSVVEKGHGKAAKIEGVRVAGKTGTAQIANKDGKGYEEDAHIGGFIGYAPADDPKFVMLVKLDRPTAVKFAESSAAPTFHDIAQWLLTNYYR